MNSILRILVPFDFGSVAESALKYAIKFCAGNKRTDIMLCYVATSQNYKSKRNQMDKYLSSVSVPGYSIDGKVIEGDFVDALLREQIDFKAEMMIMGTKGASESSGKATSNTSSITLEAHCPVLVIPVSNNEFKISKITLAIGNSKIVDPSVLSTLLVIARKYDAKIHVLTVYDEGDDDYALATKNEAVLKYYFEKYYSQLSSTKSSNIGESIIEYDKKHGIDLLAIIPQNHSKTSAPTKGRLTKFLTLKSEIPLLSMNR